MSLTFLTVHRPGSIPDALVGSSSQKLQMLLPPPVHLWTLILGRASIVIKFGSNPKSADKLLTRINTSIFGPFPEMYNTNVDEVLMDKSI